jgi:hypothetical protein
LGIFGKKTFDGRQRDDPGISKPGVIALVIGPNSADSRRLPRSQPHEQVKLM